MLLSRALSARAFVVLVGLLSVVKAANNDDEANYLVSKTTMDATANLAFQQKSICSGDFGGSWDWSDVADMKGLGGTTWWPKSSATFMFSYGFPNYASVQDAEKEDQPAGLLVMQGLGQKLLVLVSGQVQVIDLTPAQKKHQYHVLCWWSGSRPHPPVPTWNWKYTSPPAPTQALARPPPPPTTNSPSIAPTAKPTESPTSAPTSKPTGSPTGAPTSKPTGSPTSAPTAKSSPQFNKKKSGAHGDPHFLTFSGKKFDFHGGCDLVLFTNTDFQDGDGMEIHIRTKISSWWSYIETAVLRIGKDTLEVIGGKNGGPARYWINGKPGKALVGDDLPDDLPETIGGHKVHHHNSTPKKHRFIIQLGQRDAISIETFNEMIHVNLRAVSERFIGSSGLLGNFPEGIMMARDNTTVLEDPIEFGKEWQVRFDEPKLFHDVNGVQHPTECEMPVVMEASAKRKARRRLGETLLSEEDAETACAHVDELTRDACVFDVLAINDKDIAGSY